MNAKDALRTALVSTQQILAMYLADLSDADLLVRPLSGANHIAWQLGHLISSEREICTILPGASYPELPRGFTDQHSPARAAVDPPTGFSSKAEYLALFSKVREATLATLTRMTESDLDRANTGPLAKFAPTLGALLILTANHTLMHGGQFTVVRRKLGKPIIF